MPEVTEQQIAVRKVTHWQPTFTVTGPSQEGVYTFQLILDQGAEEAVLTLTEGDADNLFDWLSASSEVYYDTSREVLMFGTRPTGS